MAYLFRFRTSDVDSTMAQSVSNVSTELNRFEMVVIYNSHPENALNSRTYITTDLLERLNPITMKLLKLVPVRIVTSINWR